MPSIFFINLKFQTNIFKLNRLVGLIFGNIEFWRPILPDGRQNLTKYRMDLKMVSKRPQRILMNLQLLFESVQLAPPPTLFRVKTFALK